jgi:acetolactate synthase-1/2/3 large subunit
VKSTTKLAYRFMEPVDAEAFVEKIAVSWTPRKGPVFLEMPLDVQAAQVEERHCLRSRPGSAACIR